MKYKELKVGLFTVIVLGLLYFGFNFLKGIDFFNHKKVYFAVYDNIDQLAISNPVLINGYAVGRVSIIRILQNKNNKVLIGLEIDANISIPDSTTAILNSELLGGRSVLLKIGPSRKILQQYDTLQAEVAKGIFDALSATATPVATDLQITLRNFNAAIDAFTRNFNKLEVVLTRLQQTPGLLNKMLVTSDTSLRVITATFKKDADKIEVMLDELKPTLHNAQVFTDSLKQFNLKQTMNKIDLMISNANDALSRLHRSDNTLGRLITEDTLYQNLNQLVKGLDKLSRHIEDNPKDFLAPLGRSKKKIQRELKREQKKEQRKAQQTTASTP